MLTLEIRGWVRKELGTEPEVELDRDKVYFERFPWLKGYVPLGHSVRPEYPHGDPRGTCIQKIDATLLNNNYGYNWPLMTPRVFFVADDGELLGYARREKVIISLHRITRRIGKLGFILLVLPSRGWGVQLILFKFPRSKSPVLHAEQIVEDARLAEERKREHLKAESRMETERRLAEELLHADEAVKATGD